MLDRILPEKLGTSLGTIDFFFVCEAAAIKKTPIYIDVFIVLFIF